MKILLVGAGGFLGREILKQLEAAGHETVAVDLMENPGFRSTWIAGDLRRVDWSATVGRADAVICTAASLAAGSTMADWISTVETNGLGLLRLVQWSLSCGVQRFVYTSSAGMYGLPAVSLPVTESAPLQLQSAYWTSKFLGEQLLRSDEVRSSLSPWILRLSSPYGPLQKATSVFPRFVQQASAGEVLRVDGDGSRSQDFISVWDAAAAHISCLKADRIPGDTPINLGSGEETSMLDLARAVSEVFGSSVSKIVVAAPQQPGNDRFVLDVSAARSRLGHNPVPLRQGLRRLREEMP